MPHKLISNPKPDEKDSVEEIIEKAARLQREQEIFLLELKGFRERLEGLESRFRRIGFYYKS